MATAEELRNDTEAFFAGEYAITTGRGIPLVGDVAFGKEGKEVDLAMLFVDIRESTKIVDGFRRKTAAKMYKSFLSAVTKIIRSNSGQVVSYNGDGLLASFYGDAKKTHASKAALQINWFGHSCLKPMLDKYFKNNLSLGDFTFDYGIGIDAGKILVVRGGIRNEPNNSLIWVGNATNIAVKLSDIPDDGYHIFISEDVYKNMNENTRFGGKIKQDMWEKRTYKEKIVYRSDWIWEP